MFYETKNGIILVPRADVTWTYEQNTACPIIPVSLYDKPEFPQIKKVIFNSPATIIYWSDKTKTVVKCQDEDIYSKEHGLALCIAKKALGNKSNFNNIFKKWCGKD